MTNPNTCGASGGAVSMWYKVTGCASLGAIVSTMKVFWEAGFSMHCNKFWQIG